MIERTCFPSQSSGEIVLGLSVHMNMPSTFFEARKGNAGIRLPVPQNSENSGKGTDKEKINITSLLEEVVGSIHSTRKEKNFFMISQPQSEPLLAFWCSSIPVFSSFCINNMCQSITCFFSAEHCSTFSDTIAEQNYVVYTKLYVPCVQVATRKCTCFSCVSFSIQVLQISAPTPRNDSWMEK